MATATATKTSEMQATLAVKRPGPPVPPRPKTATANAAAAAAAGAGAVAAATPCPPLIQKKPTFVSQLSAVGRTLVYKSPSLNLQKKQAQTQTPTMALVNSATATGAAATVTVAPITTTPPAAPATAPKPPLKLRKAPAVPTAKPRESVVSVNRANSLTTQSTPPHKDTRLSLGKVDFERAGLLPAAQPLPKPRKIVQMPVATLDVEDVPVSSIFRRSKTTLDSPLSSQSSGGSYLGGKTVEFKNNLKNAAERLFSEIIISQTQKQTLADTTIITKHERAIQHQALLEQELAQERLKRQQQKQQQQQQQLERERKQEQEQEQLSQVIQAAGNCTRININTSSVQAQAQTQTQPKSKTIKGSVSAGNTPEKKHAFHELLISELAAMRNRACSLEQLPTKWQATPTKTRQRYNSIEDADTEDVDADNVEDADGDEEDDTLTYAVNKSLKDNANGSSTPRKRCPSGCSSDSSPYGTERSQRIRTSDWIEVGDNGKQVTLTSCHISLEDSGMEDEERLDDMSSSGVGDSWDSVKEAERENEKRCRNVKRGMSISGLPPLPKSLSGFNKLLGSDSGLLSDVDVAQQELNNNNNNSNSSNINSNSNVKKENDSGNKLASQIVSDNNNKSNSSSTNNNNNNLSGDKQASKDSSSQDNADDKSATATADSATATSTPTSPAKINVTGSTLDAQIATLRKEMGNRRHSPTPSSYDSVSSEGGADADLVKAKRLGTIPKVITTQPKQLQPKGDLKPLPRMRSAPPPPPPVALMCTARKAAAPPRPT
ncbi:PREDICTED: ras guanine nucleotide exchange factor B [Drosophila arizonae]|uniref:Ras guanine nucleotide exchange factor B n=1 Tax=Drosophila arizonae TaxID=7263 RepID=A0ABM1Q3H3_DROAR|nr:PREDICTED: ras guanine nucleotide exchange factor B [Drosophila arizonae]